MKLDILIVDFALLVLVFIPYVLFIFIGSREVRKLKNKFKEEALHHQLIIDEKDSWNSNIIGVDTKKAIILLVQNRKTEVHAEFIKLKEVKNCEILREVQTLKIDKRTEEILQRIDLRLTCRNDSIRIVNLYNCEENYAQEYELKHAEKWNNKINSMISYRPAVNSAA
ncbi:hypothetical protein [Salinimicrobium flavum]|uniref:Uncharacterized protein n=1 Tax=Salinimicrobium flavum TaxID=1737065 RepID=A0ABW5IVE1_9FLAO